MRETKDSGVPWIGEIPIGWKLLRNKNAFLCSKEIVGNKSAKTQLLSLTTKGIKKKGPDVIGGKVPESFDTYQTVLKGQLVMCLFDLDCSAVFSGLSPFDGMISPAYKVVDCKDGMTPSFASYWFSSVFDGRKFMHYSKNLRYTLTYDEFAVLPIAIPPLSEQNQISTFLDAKCAEINTILEKTKASIEEYKKLEQSVITESVTKGIRGNRPMKDSGVEWIGDIPMEWSVSQVKHQFELKTGTTPVGYDGTPSGRQLDWFTPSDILTEGCILDVAERKLNQSVILDSGIRLFPKGSILLVGIGATAGKVGYLQIEGYSNQQITALIPKTCFGKYYYYYFVKDRQRLLDNALFTTLPIINNSYLSSVLIVNPPISEQQEIAAYLDEKCAAIDSLIASKEALIAELEVYKKSLIYEYVTGTNEVLVQEGGVS